MIARPLLPTLFPYTTLFRSAEQGDHRGNERQPAHEQSPRQLLVLHPMRDDGILTEPSHLVFLIVLEIAHEPVGRSEEHTSELQSLRHLVCRLLLEKKKHE